MSAAGIDAAGTAAALAVPAQHRSAPGSSIVDLVGHALRIRRTIVGLLILTPVVVIALVGPWLAPQDPRAFIGSPFSPPGVGGILGTDAAGRDVLSRLLVGGQSTLLVALAATVLGVGVGTLLGLSAALAKGWGDTVIMRTLDVILAFPQYVFILIVLAMFDTSKALTVILIAIVWVPQVARVMRAAALSVAAQDFVRYSQALGSSRLRVLFGDVLANVTAPLSVEFGLRLSYSIALVAGLGFLGFGPPPPAPDWGVMISENQGGLTIQPLATLSAVICVAVLTLGSNLVTEGLASALARGPEGDL